MGRWEAANGDRVNRENTVNNGLKKEKTIQTKNQIYGGPERSRALQLKKTPAKANKTEIKHNRSVSGETLM